MDVCGDAGCHLAGGHSVDDPEPKYGLAVTGIADPDRLLRNDSGKPGTPLSLTKPLGIGVLNSRHKATGERFAAGDRRDDDPQRRRAAAAALARRRRMRHGRHRIRAARAPAQAGAGQRGHRRRRRCGRALPGRAPARRWRPATSAAAPGATSTGCAPHVDAVGVDEDEALLLADAQTSGGLLIAGEIPGRARSIGELVARGEHTIVVR